VPHRFKGRHKVRESGGKRAEKELMHSRGAALTDKQDGIPFMKMLICEDEIGVVNILKRYLKYKGFDADHALNGRAALELIKSRDYGIVFLDISMPELTGIEIMKHMKENHSKAKIIVLTGYPGVTSDFCVSMGADRYLEKPIDLKVIGEIVDKYTPS